MRRLEVSARAGREIDRILDRSLDRHRQAPSDRYRTLLLHAFERLREEPERPGTQPTSIGGLRIYSLRHASRSLPPEIKVRVPAHVIAYRFGTEHVRIMRVLHNAMDMPKRLSRGG